MTVSAAILIIGNEILSGRTRDANMAFLGERLTALGIPVVEARIVPDDRDAIGTAVNDLRSRCTYVFTSGGIGPTHDDITAAAVARAFGVPLERNAAALRLLESHYPPDMLNAARLSMADIPVGAVLIDNPVSRAPGFRLDNVHVLAGVPQILQAMFDGLACGVGGGAPPVAKTVSCDIGEGTVAAGLAAIEAAHPGVSIGSYPYFRPGGHGASLVVRGTDADLVASAAAAVADLVKSLGGNPTVVDGVS